MEKKKQGKSTVKKITGWLHLWLGLVSGLIVFFVAGTGTIFTYCDEITDLWAGKDLRTEKISEKKLPPETLIAKFRKEMPQADPFYFDDFRDPHKNFRIASEIKKNKSDHEGALYYTYMNPYTGEILGTYATYNFFFTVAHLHSQMMLEEAGRRMIGVATIIFFLQLIGGLILWWPKKWNKNTRDAAFKIKKGTKWRRKNYDFHNVFGFYGLIPAILLTVTGLIMSYETIGNLVHKAFDSNVNGATLRNKFEPKFDPKKTAVPYQKIINDNFKDKNIEQIRLSINPKSSMTTYFTSVGRYIGLRSNVRGRNFLTDIYTGKELALPKDIARYDKVYNTYYDLHSGYFFGNIGKFITFLAGLICTSLPITGFLIWYGRKFKKKPTPAVKKIHNQRKHF